MTETQQKPVNRYRLNVGRHVQDHPTERIREGGMEYPADQVFVQGQVVETTEDLERLNAAGAGGPKFTKLDEPRREETIEELEARLAQMRERQAATSQQQVNRGKTEVQKAAEQGFNSGTMKQTIEVSRSADAVVPNMPRANPGNVVPSPQEQADGGKVSLARMHAMSVKQLQDLAAEEEVDLKGANQKDAIIRILRGGK